MLYDRRVQYAAIYINRDRYILITQQILKQTNKLNTQVRTQTGNDAYTSTQIDAQNRKQRAKQKTQPRALVVVLLRLHIWSMCLSLLDGRTVATEHLQLELYT